MRHATRAGRRISSAMGWLRFVALSAGIAMTASTVAMAQSSSEQSALIIGNDRGGSVRERLIRIRDLRISGQPVRIQGDICYSSCTLMLGLSQVCVNPNTTFGFHGPSISGRPMSQADFDNTSRIMASYYPRTMRDWFMNEARHTITSVHRVKGSELIRHGVRACTS